MWSSRETAGKIQEVLARYVRATDRRDGTAQGALFTDDAIVQIHTRTGPDSYEPFGEPLIGGAGVERAVENLMAPHPEGGSSHHTTTDHIIDIHGDDAHLSAQFVVFSVRASARAADGWPEGAFGVQGTVRPIESGYYETDLRRVDGEWRIAHHSVLMDMPIALPGA
ncbi:nuclear transport factor 2 family protein [Streptomyces sp. DSM 41524]|uniref:Nuclear transport factor 2 family protein n=1 Tax=Streptomyces asiaticus subsp. ignotus TaxID=3098222 RepID=A0ABU7PTV9_9ACTN|nr:nuclear transport factor 2 family protein [Streptomyces sp. DSM 41524]